ncbi:hypothetical protein JXA84_00860 [candidate division WOR-3 bacterium]|nr:hypothetical protein [candidate division WOR-3 bacterium]
MYLFILLSSGFFLGIMLPTFFVSTLSRATVKILESLKFFDRGRLKAEKRTYITGSGHYRNAVVYLFTNSAGSEKFVNARVFFCMFLVFEIFFLSAALIAFFALKLFGVI